MEAIKTVEYRGYKINIFHDDDLENPREWDNLGTMICFHRRYDLGDKHHMDIKEARDLESTKGVVSLPLYLYDHSGLAMNTTGFDSIWPHARWDSCQVGFIYVTREKILEEYDRKNLSEKIISKVLGCLKTEVETYDQYLKGEVYGYGIDDPEGVEMDSCWGFFGDLEKDIIPGCKIVIDQTIYERRE